MRKILRLLAIAASVFPAAVAASANPVMAVPQTFVAVATFTPAASGANVLAFQNTSATLDVRVIRIDLVAADTGAATGGLMQYWVYASTSLTAGGVSQTSDQDYQAALMGSAFDTAQVPGTAFQLSTGPVNVLLESSLPILPPLLVNNGGSSTGTLSNTSASYVDPYYDIAANLLLPHGTNRALVFQKVKYGGTDVTDGLVMARIFYSVR